LRGRGKGSRTFGVNELRCYEDDEYERTGVHGRSPKALTVGAPFRFALSSARLCGNRGGSSAAQIKQDHQRGKCQDGDKEEHIIADNRPDHGHLSTTRRQDAIL